MFQPHLYAIVNRVQNYTEQKYTKKTWLDYSLCSLCTYVSAANIHVVTWKSCLVPRRAQQKQCVVRFPKGAAGAK